MRAFMEKGEIKMTGSEIIEKRNILNHVEFKSTMSLTALRLFTIYLGKINPRKENTRKVRFTFKELQLALGVSRINVSCVKKSCGEMLGTYAYIPNETGFEMFNIFSSCRTFLDENGVRVVEMNATEEAMPLLFGYKKEYFTFALKEALNMKSVTALRLFEVLSQYKNLKKATIPLDKLKKQLYLPKNSNARWDNFETRVLQSAKSQIENGTSLRFSYKPVKEKEGSSHKVTAVEFFIDIDKTSPFYLCDDEALFVNEPETVSKGSND